MRLLIIILIVIILLLSYFRNPIKNKIVDIYNKIKAKIKK